MSFSTKRWRQLDKRFRNVVRNSEDETRGVNIAVICLVGIHELSEARVDVSQIFLAVRRNGVEVVQRFALQSHNFVKEADDVAGVNLLLKNVKAEGIEAKPMKATAKAFNDFFACGNGWLESHSNVFYCLLI